MNRALRFAALSGVSAGLLFSLCGCRGVNGTPPYKTQKPEIAIQLARAAHTVAMPGAGKEDAIDVAVTRNDMVFLGIDRIDISKPIPRVRDLLANSVVKEVYIRAETSVKF